MEETTRGKMPWYKDLAAWTAISTIVNVVISCLLWWTTHRTADIAQESTNITKRIFESTNRPYVSIEGFIFNKLEDRKTIRIEVHIKNVGPVPANNYVSRIDLLMNDEIMSHERRDPPGRTILFPNQVNVLNAAIYGGIYDRVIANQGKLGVEINLEYTDINGEKRFYRATGFYQPEWNSFAQTHSEGN